MARLTYGEFLKIRNSKKMFLGLKTLFWMFPNLARVFFKKRMYFDTSQGKIKDVIINFAKSGKELENLPSKGQKSKQKNSYSVLKKGFSSVSRSTKLRPAN